jgi:transcriptional regulator with GAF, ATPase, and Fis domain
VEGPRFRTQTGNPRQRRTRTDAPYLFVALQCAAPLDAGARFCLGGADEVTLGRGAQLEAVPEERTVHLKVPDGLVSGRHARLSRVFGDWVLEDVGSRNGTFLDGRTIAKAPLADGALFQAGQTFFVFRSSLPQAANVVGLQALEGQSPGLVTLLPSVAGEFAKLAVAARSETKLPLLLQGETGTGKELVATAIHQLSGRPGPFVAVNCGALPATLVESELFGYRKGAFTSALEDRPGLIRSADRGTLLLDEIGDLPLPAQAALLRVLQEEEVTPVGGTRPVKIDLRVIAATHRDLKALVEQEKFRRDLYTRLSGFTLSLPPLRERREDLGLLIASLLKRIAPGRPLKLTPEAGHVLLGHSWPGNVRELEKCLAGAAVFAREDLIDVDELPAALREPGPPRTPAPPAALPEEDRLRREQVISLLREHGGNVTSVAKSMGKARTQVQRWLRRYSIDPLQYRR